MSRERARFIGLVIPFAAAFTPLSPPVLAGCPADEATFRTELYTVQDRFTSMDLPGFNEAMSLVRDDLSCLIDPLPPRDAAGYHRVEAIDAYLAQDRARALSSFRASAEIQPEFELPASVALPGNPLYQLYEEALESPPTETREEELPNKAQLLVDGAPSPLRSSERPSVVQLLSEDGQVLWSGVLEGGAPSPDWKELAQKSRPSPAAAAPTVIIEDQTPGKPSRPLLWGTVSTAALAGGLYGYAWANHLAFQDADTDLEQLSVLQGRTNFSVFAASGVGAVSAGLGVATVLSVRW